MQNSSMFENITNVADAGGVGKDAVGSSNMNTGTSGSGSVAMGMNGFHAHVQFPAAHHNSTNRSFAADATSTAATGCGSAGALSGDRTWPSPKKTSFSRSPMKPASSKST